MSLPLLPAPSPLSSSLLEDPNSSSDGTRESRFERPRSRYGGLVSSRETGS